MSVSTAGSIMMRAATHLNDINQLVYNNEVLLPMLINAFDELEEELSVYEVTPLRRESIIILVPAGSLELPQMPIDFVEAIALHERPMGSMDLWTQVKESVVIDANRGINPVSSVVQWTIRGPEIAINPPSTDREAMLQYITGLTEPTQEEISIDIEQSRRFLALTTARNAARDLGNSITKANSFENDIGRARDRLVRRLQKQTQTGMGTRRRPYAGRG
jgi:hypothetical protein